MAAVAPRGGVAEELSAGGRGGDYFLEAIVTPGGGSENPVSRVNVPPLLITEGRVYIYIYIYIYTNSRSTAQQTLLVVSNETPNRWHEICYITI